MANLFDYLDWRGDLDFSDAPFQEVDNLVLSEMAYVDFAGIVPGPEEPGSITVAEASRRFWEIHTKEEVNADKSLVHMAPFLLEKMAASRRFADLQLSGYVNYVTKATEEQMCALTCRLPDGSLYVAYRGTDDTLTGWKEDFNLSFMEETAGQRRASDYLSSVNTEGVSCLRVGGHSKGGNFAVYASAFCKPPVREKIREVYSNDGPGFLQSVTEKKGYREILPRIISIIPGESLFGLLLNSGYPHKVIHSSQKGVWQHDALSWEVLGNHFVEEPGVTAASAFMEKALDKWIFGIPIEERRSFVDALFELIDASGADNVSELQQDRLKKTLEMVKSFMAMGSEDQKVIRETLWKLFQSGAKVLQTEKPFEKPFGIELLSVK